MAKCGMLLLSLLHSTLSSAAYSVNIHRTCLLSLLCRCVVVVVMSSPPPHLQASETSGDSDGMVSGMRVDMALRSLLELLPPVLVVPSDGRRLARVLY